jgi:hypothetical protein
LMALGAGTVLEKHSSNPSDSGTSAEKEQTGITWITTTSVCQPGAQGLRRDVFSRSGGQHAQGPGSSLVI